MADTFWYKQTSDKPLYPNLLWSKPENKLHAGKLLIVGGNQFAFSSPAECFNYAGQAGVGSIRVVLPQAVRKIAGKFLPAIEYAASNPSGSFSKQALGDILEGCSWGDGVLLAGDFGHNSETTILLESLISKISVPVLALGDAVDLLLMADLKVIVGKEICLLLDISQLQKLCKKLRFDKPFTRNMNLEIMVDQLRELYKAFPIPIVIAINDTIFISCDLLVTTTYIDNEFSHSKVGTYLAVWWLQNPKKRLKALTTAVYETINQIL